jgi:hypothetical protein
MKNLAIEGKVGGKAPNEQRDAQNLKKPAYHITTRSHDLPQKRGQLS